MLIVLVHGLWLDAGSWAPVRAVLDEAGVRSSAPDLPLTDLDSDVAAVRAVLDQADGPVLLAGHSYGGAVITAAGLHDRVARLAYIAAFQLDEGESVSRVRPDLDLPQTGLAQALRFVAGGTKVALDESAAEQLLYHDAPCPPGQRLRPCGRALFSARPGVIAWRSRPSVYAVCTEDRVVAPQLQEVMAQRAQATVRWPTGHVPLAGRPELVARLLLDEAAQLDDGAG